VYCPKVFIDWFVMLVSLVLKLFVSSRPLKLEGVLCIYVLLFHEGQAENHLYVLHMIWTHVWLSLFHFHDLSFVFFSCYNMVAKFLLSRLYLSCPCFKFFWSQRTTLKYMVKIVYVHVTSKIISFVMTYLLENEQELSLGMLIRLQRIHNFWCSMFVFTPFA
jgi:hypothetical protein